MEKNLEEEVKEVLAQGEEKVVFEESLDAQDSPLNQPVAEGEIGHTSSDEKKANNDSVIEPDSTHEASYTNEQTSEKTITDDESTITDPDDTTDFYFETNPDDDVPEQEIGSSEYEEQIEDEMPDFEDFEIPKSHAKQATDTIFGIANNIMTIGGGFFIKIKKHKEFYDFDEVIQIIEQQNEKNVTRLKLDEEDKVLLRPLLITILKRKAKQLTPEEQLIGAVISILMKKVQMVMEIKAENDILVERILDVIREEKGYSDQDITAEAENPTTDEEGTPPVNEAEIPVEEQGNTVTSEIIEEAEIISESPDNLGQHLLEVADQE